MDQASADDEESEIRCFGSALLALHGAETCDRLWQAVVKLVEGTLPFHFMASVLSFDASMPTVTRTSGYGKADRTRHGPGNGPHPCLRMTDFRPGAKLVTHKEKADKAAAKDGAIHVADLFFREAGALTAYICICRTGEPGKFTAAEKKRLLALHPHIGQAIRRVGERARNERLVSLLGAALEHPSDGLVLLDTRGSILHQNQAAADLCAILRNGRAATRVGTKAAVAPLPDCLSSSAERLLADYEMACRNGSAKDKHFELETMHPSGVRARLRIVAPRGGSQETHVRIDLTRVTDTTNGIPRALPCHRLSAGERRVVELVAGGMSNNEVAEALELSVNTVRAHLREAFSKLEVQRRGQLAGLGRPAYGEAMWHFNS